MKTSTPSGSPMRKKHSLAQNFISIEDNQDDIATEIQHRRLEAINKSTELRRKSLTVPLLPAGYSAAQLSQHWKDCIKLSTENKINIKNAFSFLLIDVMAAMTKKNDSEINQNFQIASCTLDASVKIYGYRVDAVHTEVMKMAGGFANKEIRSGEEDEFKETDDAELKKKVKAKKRKKLTIVPAESLNSKSEAEVLLDIIPRRNFLSMKTDGNDLLIKIPKHDDNGMFILDSDCPCWPEKNMVSPFASKTDVDGLLSVLNDIVLEPNEKLCPVFDDFEFGKDYEECSDDELNLSQQSSTFEFDVNASVQDDHFSEHEDIGQQRDRFTVPVGGYESGDEIVLPPQPCQVRNQRIGVSDMKKRISVNPLEYSMFDEKVFKCWAGPTYWKVRPTLTRKSQEDKENEEGQKQVQKRTRKGKAKEPIGLFEVSEDVLARHLATGEKSTLCKTTMLNWHPKNTTMPKDCKYKSRNLVALFGFSSIQIQPKFDEDCDVLENTYSEPDQDVQMEEELDYCSSLTIRDEGDDNCSQINLNISRPDVEEWGEQNMVAAPNKVEKIAVSAFKRKKHVDIINLKKCLWNILTDTGAQIDKPIEFSQLIKNYPSKIPSALAGSLSAPMIFNALLHLTNEKCLVLGQDKSNKLDFLVSQ